MPWLMCSFAVHAGRLPSAVLARSDPVPLCVCAVRGPAILQLPEVQGGALTGGLAQEFTPGPHSTVCMHSSQQSSPYRLACHGCSTSTLLQAPPVGSSIQVQCKEACWAPQGPTVTLAGRSRALSQHACLRCSLVRCRAVCWAWCPSTPWARSATRTARARSATAGAPAHESTRLLQVSRTLETGPSLPVTALQLASYPDLPLLHLELADPRHESWRHCQQGETMCPACVLGSCAWS